MTSRRNRHIDQGFTLVEILIVVAMLALLLGLAVPYYGGVHARAQFVECQGNLRTVGVGVQAYLNTHDTLPVSEHLANPHTELLAEMLGSYVPAKAFYCPAEKRNGLRYSDRNIAAGNITYFYYCCRKATPYHEASQFLWRAGITNPKWPRGQRLRRLSRMSVCTLPTTADASSDALRSAISTSAAMPKEASRRAA